jgi:RND family efflux transporter MFP subunit
MIRSSIVLVALLAAGCSKGAEGGKAGQGAGRRDVRVVSVEKAAKRHLEMRGVYRGELKAEKVVEVAPDVQGRVKKLYADMGYEVKKGDLLLELDQVEMNQMVSEGKARVDVAAASIVQAEVALKKAEADLERKSPLAKKGLITPAEMDNLETAVESARSSLEVAKASHVQAGAGYKNLLVNRKNMKVRAPFDGVIARRYLNEGAMASPASPVFQLHAAGKLFMRISVPEKDVPWIRTSMAGTLVMDALPSRTYVFSVDVVSPVVEPATRTCTVDLLVEPGEGGFQIKPGMTGEATMILDEVNDALSIPRDAVLEKEEGKVVFVIESAKARQVPVKVLGEYGDWLWVEGVADGADVVVKGQLDLEDGAPVLIATLE